MSADEGRTILGEGDDIRDRVHTTTFQQANWLPIRGIPEPHRAIMGRCDDALAYGREDDFDRGITALQDMYWTAVTHVPENHRSIMRSRGQGSAVRTESNPQHLASMAREPVQNTPVVEPPHRMSSGAR